MGIFDIFKKIGKRKEAETEVKEQEKTINKCDKEELKERSIVKKELDKKAEYKENELLEEIPSFNDLFKWCREESSEKEVYDVRNIFGHESFQKLYKYNQEKPENDAKTARILETMLNEMDIMKACAVANYCGVLLEKSRIFDIGFGLVDLFDKVVSIAYDFINNESKDGYFNQIDLRIEDLQNGELEHEKILEVFHAYPDETRALKGAELITLAVMDVITREHEVREYFRSKNIYKKIKFLEPYVKSIVYTGMVHDACYDFKVMVLCPENKKGFYMKAYDIHNCFYLMTLLEAEIYRQGWADDYKLKGYEFNENLYNVAVGTMRPDHLYTIEAHSIYSSYDSVKKAKEYQDYSPLSSRIFGEMPPEYIPQYKGCPILIMSEDSISGRISWDSNFTFKCHDGLDPHIEILDELSRNQVDEILEDLSGIEINADEQNSVYEKKILEILNDKVEDSILKDDSVHIPSVGLEIKVKFVQFNNNGVQAEFFMNHEMFIEQLREFVIGIDSNIQVALENAVNSFCRAALTGIINGLCDKGGQTIKYDFYGTKKQFKLYKGEKAGIGERTNFKDTDYWSIVKDEIIKRLGNKPVYWIKIYLCKVSSGVECECRINDVISDEITKLLNKVAEKWNITTQFCDEKQYFVLIQDKSTYVPYKFSKEQVMEYASKTADLYRDCDTDEKYENLFEDIYKICGDISLAIDLKNFVPEMMCQIAVTKAQYNEFFFMNDGGKDSIKVYRDSLTSYNWIFEELIIRLNEGSLSIDDVREVAGFSSLINCFSSAVENGSKIEDVKAVCYYPISEDYIIS